MSNVSPYQYPSSSPVPPQPSYIPPVTYQPQFSDNTQLDTGFSPADELLDNLTKQVSLLAQQYKTQFPQTNNQLRTSSNTQNQASVQNGRVVVQNVQGRHNRVQGNINIGTVVPRNGGAQYRAGNANARKEKLIKCYNCNGIGHIARNYNQPKRPQNSDYYKEKMLLMQARENIVDLDEEQLLFLAGGQTNTFDDDVDEGPVQDMAKNEDNIFQADQCDAFEYDVDEAPTTQTLFMANLSSAEPVYDEAGPSYDSDTLSEEESLQKELHSVKTQLNSTINHNKLIREEVSTLKQDFKQKENKLLEEFLDMKHLKEMVEYKLYKQDQSLQTVHMLCKPKSFYDEVNRVAIGYKNPFYPSKAKQVQPALYNGHEIVKTNHDRALVHDLEDT
ncbi:retrovirus-related pol polyprotein from transposon TNT 1-94 [Tanacetum coccineum]